MTIQSTIDNFFRAWNASTDGERRAVEATWTDDGTVTDPLADVRGHDAITSFLAEAVAQFPGHVFRPSSGVDAHHDVVRFGWTLVGPDGSTVVEGLEVGFVDGDGRLRSTLGFFGPLPSLAEVAT